MSALHGWLVLDKAVGPGSTDMVSAVKRLLRDGGYGKVKVGHGGTLDPLASGVLPIALGEATKLAGRMLDADKAYDFTIRFGVETDTLDAEGAVVTTSDVRPDAAAIAVVLPRFTGPIRQVPPVYSALKIGGQRAYDLARGGAAPEMVERSVTVHALHSSPERGGGRSGDQRHAGGMSQPRSRFAERTDGEAWWTGDEVERDACAPRPLHQPPAGPPPRAGEELTLTALVSKGTYIRSLARDIAYALGTVGHVVMLRRLKAGPFTLTHAVSLDSAREAAMAGRLEDLLLPLRAGLDDIPALPLSPDQAGALRQGRVLTGIAAADGPAFATLDDEPVALVEVETGSVRVVRGFNL